MPGPPAARLLAACACAAALYALIVGGMDGRPAGRGAPPGAVLACGVRDQAGPHGRHLVASRAHAAGSILASVHVSQMWCEHHFTGRVDGGPPQLELPLPSPAYAHPVLGGVVLRVSQPVLEQVARDAGRVRVCSRSPRRVALATALLGASRACGCLAGQRAADGETRIRLAPCRRLCRMQPPATHLMSADPAPLLASPPPPHSSFRAAVADAAHLSWSCALHEAAGLVRRLACDAQGQSQAATVAANATAALCRGAAALAPLLGPTAPDAAPVLSAAASGALAWEWVAWHRVAESRMFGIAPPGGESADHWSCLVPLADLANHGVDAAPEGAGLAHQAPRARHIVSAPCLPWPGRDEAIPAPWAATTPLAPRRGDSARASTPRERPNAMWQIEGNAFALWATTALAPGREVLIHYGHRSLRAWLLAYAFAPRVGVAMDLSARDDAWAPPPRLQCANGSALAPPRLSARPPRGDGTCGSGGSSAVRLPLARRPLYADAAAVAADVRTCFSAHLRRQLQPPSQPQQPWRSAEGPGPPWLRVLPRVVRDAALSPCEALRSAFEREHPVSAPQLGAVGRRGADTRAVAACVAGESAFVNASRADAKCLGGHLAEASLLAAAFTQWGHLLARAGPNPQPQLQPQSEIQAAAASRNAAIALWAAWARRVGALLARHHAAGPVAAAALGLCANGSGGGAVAAGEATRRALGCVARVAAQCVGVSAPATERR